MHSIRSLFFEISGNCHFEGAMIFFLLLGLTALRQGQVARAAVWWALATASKMLPILFLPIIWCWQGWRKGLIFNIVFGLVCLALFAPVLVMLPHILESLDLYFRQFQFNASIYYLVREIGFRKTGWDIGEFSGPALACLTALGVLCIGWFVRRFEQKISLESALLFALLLYHLLSATVHPWYITVPLALSLTTRWRFAVAWSGLVMLSYSHYWGGRFQENYGLIGLEYGLVAAFFVWELAARSSKLRRFFPARKGSDLT